METAASRPTAATDLYACKAAPSFLAVAPTNLSLSLSWVRSLEPNDCFPISQVLAAGVYRAVFDLPHELVPITVGTARDSALHEFERRQAHALSEQVADTLSDLGLTWGMSWVDIAKIVGVSVPALRKWRLGEARPKRENRKRIADIVGLLSAMKELGVAEPAGRLNVRVVDNSYLTLRDVVGSAPTEEILDHVRGAMAGSDLLDRNIEAWQARFPAKIDTYLADDGERAMRLRGHRSH